jgi:hypothetical protein
MPKHIKTDPKTGKIISLLPKQPPAQPPPHWFLKGYDPRRKNGMNRGATFVKYRQRLTQVSVALLNEVAPDQDCELFGLPHGSTHSQVLVKAMYTYSLMGDTSAARLLFDMSERAKTRPEEPLTGEVFSRAKEALLSAMSNKATEVPQ